MRRRLSEHFTLEEFSVSASHPALVEPVPAALVPTVERLVQTILQPLRTAIRRPIRVTSGYRSPALNVAVGGSPTSQHRFAEAADITTHDVAEVFRRLLAGTPRLPVGQVILYPSRSFIHVALPSAKYPTPSYHVHEPTRGLRYAPVRSVAQLTSMLREVDS